jgi:tetratricopeptide (TPR) repeat protein
MILYLARRFDEAVSVVNHALETDPDHFLLHFRLGLIHIQQRKPEQAVEEMQKAVALSAQSTETLTGLAQAYAATGAAKQMQAVVKELTGAGEKRYVSPYNLARVYGCAADASRAFEWLEKAFREHNPDLIELGMEPCFDSIRSDPRFANLLERIGLPAAAGPKHHGDARPPATVRNR